MIQTDCKICRGNGERVTACDENGHPTRIEECSECDGTGKEKWYSQKELEAEYERGSRRALLLIAGFVTGQLRGGTTEEKVLETVTRQAEEMENTRMYLHALFQEYEHEWPGDKMRLDDLVDKELRALLEDQIG